MYKNRTTPRIWLKTILLTVCMVFALSFAALAQPAAPTLTKAKAGESQVKLTWTRVSGATGYAIYVKSNNVVRQVNQGKESKLKNKVTCTLTNLTNGYTYTFYVAAVKGSEKSEMSNGRNAAPAVQSPGKVANARVSANGSTSITLSWSKLSKASGYYIYQKTEDGYQRIQTLKKKTSVKIGGLKNGVAYFFKVQPYRTVDGVTVVGTMSAELEAHPDKEPAAIKSIHAYYYKVTIKKTTTATPLASGGKKLTLKKGTTIKLLEKGGKNYTSGNSIAKINGKKYYVKNKHINFDRYSFITKNKTLYSKETAEAFVNYKGYKTTTSHKGTKYLIWINTYTQRLYVFTGSQYNWKLSKLYVCATGMPGTFRDFEKPSWIRRSETPLGKGSVYGKANPWIFASNQYAYWATKIPGGAIHSWLYYPSTMQKWTGVGSLGTPSSHGCVRIDISQAKWIYDNVPTGTTVVIY